MRFQMAWGTLHMYAALLAGAAVVMHLGSAAYHYRRAHGD